MSEPNKTDNREKVPENEEQEFDQETLENISGGGIGGSSGGGRGLH